MALALYRKYRPQSFAEVIGQEHVTKPLMSAIDNGRLNHAYLFSGPRGCGKTSSARILARSLNCAQGPTSHPCGTCDSCVALGTGGNGSIDVIEIDAASHGGVDDARDLRERAVFAPVNSRFKIYVIDEAHMVSSAGFNALLKLVEEPPDYVMFVFATTEPEKVLPTIRSRTHHYPFRLMPPTAMRGLCERLCEAEGVKVDPAAYPLVIRAGAGSARDTLSVLDQLIAGADENGVTHEHAAALLGATDGTYLDQMCEALASRDGAAAMATIDTVCESGQDPRRFATDLLERLRDLIMLNQVPQAGANGIIDVPSDVLERMTAQALRLGTGTLTRTAEIMHEALSQMKGTTAPRLLLELACSRAILPTLDDSASGILQRLEQLERGVPSASTAASPAPVTPPTQPSAPAAEAATSQPPASAARQSVTPAAATPEPQPVATPPASTVPPAVETQSGAGANDIPPDLAADGGDTAGLPFVRSRWEQVKQAVKDRKKTVAAFLMEGSLIAVEDDTIVLSFRHAFHANALQNDASMAVFTEALAEALGGKWKVRCEVGEASPAASQPPAYTSPAPPVASPSVASSPPESAVAPPETAPPPASNRDTHADPGATGMSSVAAQGEGQASSAMGSASTSPGAITMDQAVGLFADRVGARKL